MLLWALAASLLQVSPDPVHLPADAPRATLTLRNQGHRTAHVVATTWSWWQSASGETRLDPSAELAVSPAELYLPPGATRTLEIEVTGPASEVERAFRLELEEEPLQAFGRARAEPQHLSVPVFVAPDKAAARVDLSGLSVEDGHAKFTLLNSGTGHLQISQLRVLLLGPRGQRLALRKLPEWTLLARGQVSYDVPVNGRACQKASSVEVELRAKDGDLRRSVPVTRDACGD
jgi:P pilus assembly chaperone PapD